MTGTGDPRATIQTAVHPAAERPILLALGGFGGATVLLNLSRVTVSFVAAGWLGPATWGAWQIVTVILVYGGLSHLGVLNAMNREVPVLRGAGRPDEAWNLQRVSLGGLLVTSVTCIALGLVAGAIAGVDMVGLALPVVALFGAQQAMVYLLMSARSNVRFAAVARMQVIHAVALPLAVLPLTARHGLRGFLLGNALALVVAGALALRQIPGPRLPTFDLRKTRDLARIGFPILGAGVVQALLVTTDRWIAGAMLGGVPLGHYGIVAMALAGLMTISGVLSQFVYPRMARSWGESRNPAELEAWSRRQMRLGFAAMVPATLAAVLVLPLLVSRYLPSFAPAIPALRLSLPFAIAYPVAAGYGNILNILDRQKLYLAVQCGALALNVVLSVTLVLAGLEITGVALGTTISYTVLMVAVRLAGRRACLDARGA